VVRGEKSYPTHQFIGSDYLEGKWCGMASGLRRFVRLSNRTSGRMT